MAQPIPFDLFVSYADADRAWVEGYLFDALNQAGVRVISEATFALGVPRLLEFERAVKESRRILLVLSPAYFADDFAAFAELLAQSYGAESATWPVIPLLLAPVELPPRLKMLGVLDASDPTRQAAAIARLCAELQRPVPAPSSPPVCPYPGMVPFAEADADRFFGREAEVEELVGRLRLHPFLAVIGPSGSGKSSLVFAGLIPALRRSSFFPGGWDMRTMRPGTSPLTTLRQTLPAASAASTTPPLAGKMPHAASAAPGAMKMDVAAWNEASPWDCVPGQAPASRFSGQGQGERWWQQRQEERRQQGQGERQQEGPARRLLLVVDQFEELFAAGVADVPTFLEAIERLAALPGHYVVLTVRADFYADLMGCALWPLIQAHRFELAPLDSRGLRQAIVRPAEACGVYIETALVERLLADAGTEPGILPFVQETLILLWEKLERRFLPLRAYEALVISRTAYEAPPRTGLQVALARRADAALAGLTPRQQALARRIFLRLVQFGEGRPPTRRQLPAPALRSQSDEPTEFDRTLAHLATSRLIVLDSRPGEAVPRVDLAHEALIQGWPALTGWISERQEAEQARRRLEAKAAEWERLGRGAGGLLDEIELREAERWLAGPDALDVGYSETLPALVEASRAALEQAAREQKAAQQRELMLERRARRLLQGLVVVIAALLLVSTAYLGRLEVLRLQARAGGDTRPVPGLPVALEKYEVTNRRYDDCVQAGRCLASPPQLSTSILEDSADYPVTGVDAIQAAAFCAWIGRRLPTAAEWQAAATDGALTAWPWADEQQVLEFANLNYTGRGDGSPQPERVGSRQPTKSGFYDLVGNVAEWTATVWREGGQEGATWDGQARTVPGDLTIVGGSYLATLRGIMPINAAATGRHKDVGFRCAEDRAR